MDDEKMAAYEDGRQRWHIANFLGAGDLAFRTGEPIAPGVPIRASKLTRVGTDGAGKGVMTKLSGYGAGVLQDPMIVSMSTMVYAGLAPKRISEPLDELWSTIKLPKRGGIVTP